MRLLMTLNDISTHVFVINLKKRLDRRQHIIEQLKSIECYKYQIIEAVDYTQIDISQSMKNGAFGLIETWKKIYHLYKDSDSNEIILIEDDCQFLPNFNVKLQLYYNYLPDDWDMIYFGANHLNDRPVTTTHKINDYCIKLSNSFTTHCLVMKKELFSEVIEYLTTTNIEVDLALTTFQKKYNAYSPIEKLTTQMPGYSDIESKWVDYTNIIS